MEGPEQLLGPIDVLHDLVELLARVRADLLAALQQLGGQTDARERIAHLVHHPGDQPAERGVALRIERAGVRRRIGLQTSEREDCDRRARGRQRRHGVTPPLPAWRVDRDLDRNAGRERAAHSLADDIAVATEQLARLIAGGDDAAVIVEDEDRLLEPGQARPAGRGRNGHRGTNRPREGSP